jgi:hypothetical protein
MTDGQSASQSWNKASIWDSRQDFYYCQKFADLLMWGALSDERMGLSFTIASDPRQRIHSRARVPWWLVIIFYRLRFESSIFVASYDSQGYGGGIRPRLHTGILSVSWSLSLTRILRQTVSWPVYLEMKQPFGVYGRIFIICWSGALSLTRGRVCRLRLVSGLTGIVTSGPSPMGLVIIFYCLKFETIHFVASCDSHCYGGGIRPRLHTGVFLCLLVSSGFLLYLPGDWDRNLRMETDSVSETLCSVLLFRIPNDGQRPKTQ